MNWFERLTGFRETTYEETRARMSVSDGRLTSDATARAFGVGRLELPSLADLRNLTCDAVRSGRLDLGVICGDVRRLHGWPEHAGAVFQVASQFNLLEMTGPDVTPERGVSGYEMDMTQGPACAIAAGAGTIYRNYFVPIGDHVGQTEDRQLDMLGDLGDELARRLGVSRQELWKMRNGYALPDADHLSRVEADLRDMSEAERDGLRALLRVGVHWDVEVTEEGVPPGTGVTQVYCSALPVGYSGIAPSRCTALASLILEAAYEATLRVGVLNRHGGGSNKVLLTRIGGGVFGNSDTWINAAILRSLQMMAGYDLEVLMVSHGPPSAAMRSIERQYAS